MQSIEPSKTESNELKGACFSASWIESSFARFNARVSTDEGLKFAHLASIYFY
jgi:hypothetical protein